jgi:uncharacterized protein (DUF433 family)
MSDDELIARYIEPNPYKSGAAEARLAESGVSVWAVIMNYHAVGRDPERVAYEYDLSPEEVCAALAYYERNRAAIDARLARYAA